MFLIFPEEADHSGPGGSANNQEEMMNKKLLTAALACVLSLGGLTLLADEYTEKDKVEFDSSSKTFSSKMSKSLKVVFLNTTEKTAPDSKTLETKLASNITSTRSDGKVFGYKTTVGAEDVFVPIETSSISAIETSGKLDAATLHLGKFEEGQTFQFGFATADGNDFVAIDVNSVKALKDSQNKKSSITVASDPLYYAGYNSDSFYQLDFANDPFDGNIEILVMGEPLPASHVTLIVALGLAAAFLLYNNRRQRVRAEQA